MAHERRANDAEFWEKVRQARLMSGEEKVLAGIRMFEAEFKRREDAIRAFMPPYAEEGDIRAILREVVARRKEIEDRPCPIYTT
jgi:hypothetical protein